MSYRRWLFIISLWLYCPALYAQTYLFWEDIQLSNPLASKKQVLKKHAVNIVFQAQRFQLILPGYHNTNPHSLDSAKSLTSKISGSLKDYTIEVSMNNLKSGIIEKIVTRKKNYSLIKDYRLALYELLYGKDFVQKNKQQLLKEANQSKKNIQQLLNQSNQQGSVKNKNDESSKSENSKPDIQINKEAQNQVQSENQRKTEKQASPTAKDLENTKNNNKAQIASDSDEDNKKNESTQNEKNKKDGSNESLDQESNSSTSKVSDSSDSPGSDEINIQNYDNTSHFSVGVNTAAHQASSNNLVNVTTNLLFILLSGSYEMNLISDSNHFRFLANAEAGFPIETDGYQVGLTYLGRIEGQKRNVFQNIFLGGHIQYDTLPFVILKGLNQGLVLNHNKTIWIGGTLGYKTSVLGHDFEVILRPAKSFIIQSSQFDQTTSLNLSGNNLAFSALFHIFDNYHASLNYRYVTFSTQTPTNSMSIGIHRGKFLLKYLF